jgi:hypothetical protein
MQGLNPRSSGARPRALRGLSGKVTDLDFQRRNTAHCGDRACRPSGLADASLQRREIEIRDPGKRPTVSSAVGSARFSIYLFLCTYFAPFALTWQVHQSVLSRSMLSRLRLLTRTPHWRRVGASAVALGAAAGVANSGLAFPPALCEASHEQGSTPKAATQPSLMAKCVAEAVGTGLIIQGGCGVVCAAKYAGSGVGTFGLAAVWGVSVMLAVYATAPISGAHAPACSRRHTPATAVAHACKRSSASLQSQSRTPATVLGAHLNPAVTCALVACDGLLTACCTRRLAGATARSPDLLGGPTLLAPGCATHSGRAAEPLRAPWVGRLRCIRVAPSIRLYVAGFSAALNTQVRQGPRRGGPLLHQRAARRCDGRGRRQLPHLLGRHQGPRSRAAGRPG